MGSKIIKIRVNESPTSDENAVCIFNHEFASNFLPTPEVLPTIIDNGMPCAAVLSLLNCTEHDIITALKSCSSSSNSPDYISYRTLKHVALRFTIYPLKVICQHSFNDGVHPARWKQATVIPLYKGHGDSASVESYRLISFCTCLGKIVVKVICAQLTSFLTVNKLLHSSQHGFVSSKSILTNLLSIDCHLANIMISGHPYDIASFDFKKTFDKSSHFRIVEAASEMDVEGRTLE